MQKNVPMGFTCPQFGQATPTGCAGYGADATGNCGKAFPQFSQNLTPMRFSKLQEGHLISISFDGKGARHPYG
jgi:hypothetical protein